MDNSGQFHVPAALPVPEVSAVPIRLEARWVLEAAWTLPGSNLDTLAVQCLG
jgi:hypothetical protein